MEISLKAYGKINLGLDVVRRREDGYHEVKMIMQTVDLWDELVLPRAVRAAWAPVIALQCSAPVT